MKEIYIHVGYPKCASTFLQCNVFPYINEVHFIYKKMKNKYNQLHPNHILLCKLYEGKNLISHETISGSTSVYDEFSNGFEIAERLKKVYPNAKIILVRRNKEKWLKSLYQQFMIDSTKNIHIKDYDDWYKNHLNHNLLRFSEYENKLKELFDDVIVLNFEDLVNDNDSFIQQICDFMNVSFPDNYIRKKAMVGLKPKHCKIINIMGRFGFHNFSKFYLLGLFRRMNRR